jgi:anaphase-promoting complex subunit 11
VSWTGHSFNMKVKITHWDSVATWRWDIPEDDVCGICQVHFDGTCPTCKFPGDNCPLCQSDGTSQIGFFIAPGLTNRLSIGKVRPQFPQGMPRLLEKGEDRYSPISGQHCIMEWINQDSAKGQCPMCRQSKTSCLPSRLPCTDNTNRI